MVQGQRGEGNFVWNDNGERLTVRWTGPFRLTDRAAREREEEASSAAEIDQPAFGR